MPVIMLIAVAVRMFMTMSVAAAFFEVNVELRPGDLLALLPRDVQMVFAVEPELLQTLPPVATE